MQNEDKKQIIMLIIVFIAIITFIIVIRASEGWQKIKNSDILTSPKLDFTAQEVIYYKNASGYLVKPKISGNYPGIVMIHEWWGLNSNIRSMAETLASKGYIVLAVDLFNGKIAQTPEEAKQLVSSLDNEEALNNLKSAVTYLKTHEAINKIGSLGWGFGGRESLQLSLNSNLDATVIYYGDITTNKENLPLIASPVLGIFASEDKSITASAIKEFDSSLEELGIDKEIYIYNGVSQEFANPSEANYAPKEAQDAWDKTLAFFDKYLKK